MYTYERAVFLSELTQFPHFNRIITSFPLPSTSKMPGIHEGKTCIVTGGAGGLGLVIAKKFFSEGANVVITDINETLLAECPSEFPDAETSRLFPVKCDGTDANAVEDMIAKTVEKYGRVDVLVNNAAVNDK